MDDKRPIGIFDSGLGGLTVAKEIHKAFPHESTIYLGDTARVPYGNRSPETVIQFAEELTIFLLKKNVKAIIIACGTASSVALDWLQNKYPRTPILGVIAAAAKEAVATTKTNHVGVIGTLATINSQAFDKHIALANPTVKVHRQSCPLFVPLVEEGIITNQPLLTEAIKHYLTDLKHTPVDTLILGCTHYPLIKPAIANYLPKMTLVNPGISLVHDLKHLFLTNQIKSNRDSQTLHQYYVTDLNPHFDTTAQAFMSKKISINKITLAAA